MISIAGPARRLLFPRLWLFLLWLSCAVRASAADGLFERPAELERDISFWVRIYTEVTTDQGLLHDDVNLGVVYEKLMFEPDTPPAARRARIEAARDRYRALLARFAAGDTGNLTPDETRILQAFGSGRGEAIFKDAMDHVRFQLGQANRFREGLMRAGIWQSHIERVLTERGVPIEIAALPHVESSFNPAAYSKVGAAGLWQFMPSTARRYMRVDSLVDERMDPFISTQAAANLMLYNYRLLGTWPLTVTAYNHGPGGLLAAQSELGSSDIATIVRRYNGRTFGFASRNFYVAFLAALDVQRHAEKYFGPIQKQPDAASSTVELPDYIPMPALISAFRVNPVAMRVLNPSLRPPIWDSSRFVPRGFTLRVPGNVSAGDLQTALARVPAAQRFLAQRGDDRYRVRKGDTLLAIAQARSLALDRLASLNGLASSASLKRGMMLRLPQPLSRAGAPPPPVVAAVRPEIEIGEAVEIQPTVQAPVQEAPLLPGAVSSTNEDPADYSVRKDQTIVVQAAETVGHYAEWANVGASRLRAINRLKSGAFVSIGHRMKLDLAHTDAASFETARRAYHKKLQEDYFATHRISGTQNYTIKKGESLWSITARAHDLPLWLIRQYNPRVDFGDLKPGSILTLPEIAAADAS